MPTNKNSDARPAGTTPISRRSAMTRLAVGGIAALGGSAIRLGAAENAAEEVTFFVTADPQIHLDKWGTAGTEKTIEVLNALPGKPFPLGGSVAEPRAILVAGDLVDTVGDPRHWVTYKSFFDPNGNAKLRFRAFECIGNHDLGGEGRDGFGSVQVEYIERCLARKGPEKFFYDKHNYHYAWDWGQLHLVNLNLFPGNVARPVYDREVGWNDPRNSLDFLIDDLKKNVGDSGRPVVLMWHYGLRGWGLEKWWKPEDLDNLKKAIAGYNVVLILHGHEHSYARYEWEGYPVFMSPSPQADRNPKTPEVPSTPKGFLVIRLKGSELQLAHHNTTEWTDSWSKSIALGKPVAKAGS
jgi:hypothetical protein